jgi:hypothetical protein
MELVVRPHLLSSRDKLVEDIDFGMTIAEVVDRIEILDPTVKKHNLAVLIDGHTVPREFWGERRLLRSDSRVEVATVLNGSGGVKKILGLVALILLYVYAGPIATALTGEVTGTTFAIAKAGVVLVGTLAINAIFAPPVANNNAGANGSGALSPTYSFSGQGNQARRYGRLPRIYGKHRYVADLAAMPYTVNVGEVQYFYALYSFGYGPLRLEEFKIGQNPLANYRDYEIVVHENFTSPGQLQIYRSDVWQDSFSFEIRNTAPVVVTTQVDTDRAILDIVFAQGLCYLNDKGDAEPLSTEMLIEYRPTGGGAWTGANIADVSAGNVDTRHYITLVVGVVSSGDLTYEGEMQLITGFYAGQDTFNVYKNVAVPPAVGDTITIGGHNLQVLTFFDAGSLWVITTEPLPAKVALATGVTTLDVICGYNPASGVTPGRWVTTRSQKGQFAASMTIAFPSKNQWEIRVIKVDADFADTDSRRLWRRYVTSVKSLKNVPPITPEVPLTIVEIKIKATGQLNGSIEQFSAVASSKLKLWNGSSWVVGETRNPAWIYLDILQGSANPRALPDVRIDLETFKAWAAKCDSVTAPFVQQLGTCDIVVDRDFTMWELLQSVATCGRAAPTMRDNKFSVLIDDATRVPVQMFTARNSSNLQSNRTYVDEPHALRVRWIDPLQDYQQADIIVYNTGRNASNSTKFEDLNSFGMTRPEQVTRWGRYMLAQGKLRQERFSIDVDIENIVCLRGDLVYVAHDVLEVGGDPARIVDIQGDRVFFDQPPALDSIVIAQAGLRIRKSNGVFTSVLTITNIGYDDGYDFVDMAAPLPAGVQAGDLVVFGQATSLVGEYVVDYVRPNNDMGATIGLEQYAPEVYSAEGTGVIPPYTVPGGPRPNPPVTDLTIQLIEFYENNVEPKGTLRVKWKPVQGGRAQPSTYRIWLVNPDGTELFVSEQVGAVYDSEQFNLPGMIGQSRTYRVRAWYEAYGISAPEDVTYVFPSRETIAPPEVSSFTVSDLGGGRRRYEWTYPPDAPTSIVGVEIRYVLGDVPEISLSWSTMEKLQPSLDYSPTSGIEIATPQAAGTYTFLARVWDKFGVLSSNGVRVVQNFTAADSGIDTTPPPTPAFFTALAMTYNVFVSVDTPTYTMGGGHAGTVVYRAVYSGTGPLPVFADAEEMFTFDGSVASYPVPAGSKLHLWAKYKTMDGVLSVSPAGGIHGVTAYLGFVGTSDLNDLIITSQKLAAGAVDALDKFTNGLEPILAVSALPDPSGYTGPKTVLLSTDGKLYRYTGGAWVRSVPTSDLTGQVVSTQIADDAITTPKLAAGAVTADEIFAGAVVAGKIAVGAIVAGDGAIANAAITNALIANAAIDDAKIANLSAAKITAGTLDVARIAANTITTEKLVVNAATVAVGTVGNVAGAGYGTGVSIIDLTSLATINISTTGSRVKVIGDVNVTAIGNSTNVASMSLGLNLFQDGSLARSWDYIALVANPGGGNPCSIEIAIPIHFFTTPSAAAHTYRVDLRYIFKDSAGNLVGTNGTGSVSALIYLLAEENKV